MRIAETVTFGGAGAGSGFDRAAHLRERPDDLGALLSAGRILPVWRGKPLVEGGERLGWVPQGSPALAAAAGPPVFLGTLGGMGLFAQDISGWTPEGSAAEVSAGFFDPSLQQHPALPDSHAFAELRGVMTALSPLEAELAATARAILGWHGSHGFCSACGHPSDAVKGGWQRLCPSCGAQHFPRTDPVVIMLVTRGNSVLVGRNAAWPEGMYSLLAGFIEPGETMEAAVRREVSEETGVTVGPVRYLASQPWPFPASLMFGCAAEALTDEIHLDPDELEDALWITREEMIGVFAGHHPRLKPARKGAIAHFLIENWLADRLD